MTWFDDASADGERSADAPLPERRRSRGVLVAWLLAGGLAVGLLVAGAASAVVHFVDNQNATGAAGRPVRPEAALAVLACGDPAPRVASAPGGTLTAEVQMLDARVRPLYAPGTPLEVIAALVNVADAVEVRAESDLAVVVVRDGVVAGEPATVDLRDAVEGGDDPSRMTVPAGIGVTAELTYRLVGCDGEELAAGEYRLLVGVRVAVGDGVPTELVGESIPFDVA